MPDLAASPSSVGAALPAAPPSPAAPPPASEPVRRARTPFGLWVTLHLMLIFGVPAGAVAALLAAAALHGPGAVGLAGLLAPLLGTTLFVLTAGLLSRPHQHAVKPGRFPRDLGHPLYRARRLYGLCWTAVYYAGPLYYLVLTLPWLKRLTFRLFGYRGQMDFTVYPDTWIRDLPLLDFGPGAYVSNKATLGTNVAQANGQLLVDHVRIGARALVGHLAMVSTGTVLEEGAEVGVGCALGSKVVLRKDASLSACCAVGHLVELGAGAVVGYASSLGVAAKVGAGVTLPQSTIVPNRARIATQAEADELFAMPLSPRARLAAHLAPALPASSAGGAPRWNAFE